MRNPKGNTSTSKTKAPCCSEIGIKRGPWTPEEDEVLANFIKKEGEGQWRTLPNRAGLLRCGKSCRLRWMNYLRPCVKRGRIAPDEEDLILRLHRLLGNRWSLIAGRIPGRTDNEIKNYWNSHLSKKLISQGIDPKTHKLFNPKPTSSINPPNRSSIPISSPFDQSIKTYPHRAIATKLSESFTMANLEKFPNPIGNDGTVNWASDDGFFMELQGGHGQNGENYMGNDGFEESFSSILDSFINESVLVSHQHYQPNDVSLRQIQPEVSSPQILNHNSKWAAEFMYSLLGPGRENGE